MKATFKNIGPIKQAEFELGDLTIIAGQNNTGKTYLVYTLYGFLAMLKQREYYFLEFMDHQKPSKEKKELIKINFSQIKENGNSKIDFNEYKTIRDEGMKAVSKNFSSGLLNQVFSTPNGEFGKASFSLDLKCINEKTENQVLLGPRGKKVSIKTFFEDHHLIFELDNPENIQVPDDIIMRGISLSYWGRIQKDCPESFILSAERFGISLFYKELDFTKNRLVEELQKLSDKKHFDPFIFIEKESARYAKPIKDNIDFTRDLAAIQRKKSDLPLNKSRSVEQIMDGYYKASNEEIRFISKRRGEKRFDIPLYLASSSARGVSDLYFYLKHVAKKGQILIIDEPESHLSPTNQILMARLLAFCVNSGLKVLITTHSDYLIKEINNLIMLSSDFEGKNKFLNKHKKDYLESDYLKPDSVKAYICEDGGLEQCKVNETGIDMPVFDDAIDNINKISNELGCLITPRDPQDD